MGLLWVFNHMLSHPVVGSWMVVAKLSIKVYTDCKIKITLKTDKQHYRRQYYIVKIWVISNAWDVNNTENVFFTAGKMEVGVQEVFKSHGPIHFSLSAISDHTCLFPPSLVLFSFMVCFRRSCALMLCLLLRTQHCYNAVLVWAAPSLCMALSWPWEIVNWHCCSGTIELTYELKLGQLYLRFTKVLTQFQ